MARLDHVADHYNKPGTGGVPTVVFGIYRKGEKVIGLDVLRCDRPKGVNHPGNLEVEWQRSAREREPANITTNSLYTVPNMQDFISPVGRIDRMTQETVLNLLVRRASCLLASPETHFRSKEMDFDDPQIVREGFTFELDRTQIRSGNHMQPDVAGFGLFERIQLEGVTQEQVKAVLEFANDFYVTQTKSGTKGSEVVFPPISKWRETRVQHYPLKVWTCE